MESRIYKETDGQQLTADIFRPSGNGPHPCLAFFHGGGWASGSPGEFHSICSWHAARGFLSISFSYRLSTRKKRPSSMIPEITPIEATKDARSAIIWLFKQTSELNIDPKRIVIGGQSVGGQLAMASLLCPHVAETDELVMAPPSPRGFLLYSSNHNTVEAWCDELLGERRTEIWSISSYHNLTENMPPVRSFHGGEDSMVPPYIVHLFKKRMEELGNRYDLTLYPHRGHYLGAPDPTYATLVDEEILESGYRWLCELGMKT